VGKRKDIVGESWDIEADMETVQKKWAEWTCTVVYENHQTATPATTAREWLT
jgi:hypothetical protein